MGSQTGAVRTAARRLGMTEDEYMQRVDAGLKHCGRCREWHPRSEFGNDASRSDGLASRCRRSKDQGQRDAYEPTARPEPGRRFVDARDDDRKQARRRVNHLVDIGVIPNPNDVQCTDCGHQDTDRRHEYDHYLGYAPDHHEHVQVVCSRCHHARERSRQCRT